MLSSNDMTAYPEHALQLLLDYDGKMQILSSGSYLKFEISLVAVTKRIPHGIKYSLTLHDKDGERLLGYDNAHPVPHQGAKFTKGPVASDHWHRTSEDPGRPYQFISSEQLLIDYFDEVERILSERGEEFNVVSQEDL